MGGISRPVRPGSCSSGDHAVVARRSPARHARVTPPPDDTDRTARRPRHPAAPRPPRPPLARPGDHRGRGHPARARDAGRDRRRGRLRARTLRLGHQLDRPRRAARAAGDGPRRRPARLRVHPPARRARLHPGRARRRAAVLPRRARPSGAPAGQLARRCDRDDGGGPAPGACAFAHARVARDARPPARPATGVRPAADPLGAAGPCGAARPRGARRDDQPRPHRERGAAVLRRPHPRPRAPPRGGGRRDRTPAAASPGRTRRSTAPRRRCCAAGGAASRCGRWRPGCGCRPSWSGATATGSSRPAWRPAPRAVLGGRLLMLPGRRARGPDRGAGGGRRGGRGPVGRRRPRTWESRWEDGG